MGPFFDEDKPNHEAEFWMSLCLGHAVSLLNERFGLDFGDKNPALAVQLATSMMAFVTAKRTKVDTPDMSGLELIATAIGGE